MFGMLDYRAHKLYLMLFGLPVLLVNCIFLLGRPMLAYFIGFSYFESGFAKVLGAVAIMLLADFVVIPIALGWAKLVGFLFSLIVDVIPADGRTDEEAKLVVWDGEKAIVAIKMNKHPREWDEASIEKFSSLDWVQGLFFAKKVRNRVEYIKRKYMELELENGEPYSYNDAVVVRLLRDGGINPPSELEKFLCNRHMRNMVYPYLIFVILIIANPLS